VQLLIRQILGARVLGGAQNGAVPEKLAPPRASERRCANKAAVDIAGVRLILSKCALCVSMCIHERAGASHAHKRACINREW
jgi:hypothetical protein